MSFLKKGSFSFSKKPAVAAAGAPNNDQEGLSAEEEAKKTAKNKKAKINPLVGQIVSFYPSLSTSHDSIYYFTSLSAVDSENRRLITWTFRGRISRKDKLQYWLVLLKTQRKVTVNSSVFSRN